MGLDQHAARLVAAPGAAGDLLDLLEAALGGAQVAARQAEIGVDHPDQGQVGEVIALGDQLGADDDVDLAGFHRARRTRRRAAGDQIVSEVTIAVRASGNSAATSSAMRSTPGPQATRLSSSPHSGQALGGGMTWPQWWQARRCISRCSTIHAVQLGHWKRWPQWRHRVSGAKPRRLRNSSDLLARVEIGLELARPGSAPASGRAAAGPGSGRSRGSRAASRRRSAAAA